MDHQDHDDMTPTAATMTMTMTMPSEEEEEEEEEPQPQQLQFISTLQPPSESRTWLSAPHPYLPFVATGTADRTVRVYSLRDFNLVSTITGGHKRSVRTCAWRPSSGAIRKGESVLATGSFDASVGIWRRWDNYHRDYHYYTDVEGGSKMDGNGGGDGYEGQDGDAREEEEEEEEEWNFAVVLDGPESEVKSVSWSAAGNLLAVSSRDKSVWIWEDVGGGGGGVGYDGDGGDDRDNFETVAVLQEHDGDVKCVAWHPREEMVASASYDGAIKMWREEIDDWECVATIDGHEGTVWSIAWENTSPMSDDDDDDNNNNNYEDGVGGGSRQRQQQRQQQRQRDPRLASCSDDLTVRIWERQPKQDTSSNGITSAAPDGRIPSIIRSRTNNDVWTDQARLPARHERSIYSIAWSALSRRIVSAGGDGRIVVYKEVPEAAGLEDPNVNVIDNRRWVVVAETQAAHDIYEINHVTWARRADRGKRHDDEEVVVSTGDNGEVKVWALS